MKTFFVETKTYFDKEVRDKAIGLAEKALPIFKAQHGFISIVQFISEDDTHMMSLIEWQTKADHEACMRSPDFSNFNDEWNELLESGQLRFELECYDKMLE